MIDGSSAYKLVEFDYLDDTDPLSGAPTMVAVPRTVAEARAQLPYNAINSLEEFFSRERLREAWRIFRKNDPFDYQLEVADSILYSCMNGLGWYIIVMITRQAGKNEISAFCQQYLMTWGAFFGHPVSGVKFAPVHKPQVQASMDRLEGADSPDSGGLAGSVLTKKVFSKSDGYKFHIGKPRESNKWAFLSINPTANVASQTAFTLLEGDEAQDIDTNKWERDAQPMGAFNNATTVLYGVAWTKECFIYGGMQQASEMERRLEQGTEDTPPLGYRPKLVHKIDAYRVIASGNLNYKKWFDNQVARLGINHIAVQTQLLLKFVDSIGRFFDPEQIDRIYASTFRMRQGPSPAGVYLFSVDVAGQEEAPTGTEEMEGNVGMHKRDGIVLTIGELQTDGTVVPVCFYQWVGKAHSKQRDQIPAIIEHWRCVGGVCDATGIGEPLAYYLVERFPQKVIEAYKFKATGDENKSKLGYLAYSYVQQGLLRMPQRPTQDTAQAELWDECKWQLEHLVRVAKKEQKINWHVPQNATPRREGHVPHDDIATAVFLLLRAAVLVKDPERYKAGAFDRGSVGG